MINFKKIFNNVFGINVPNMIVFKTSDNGIFMEYEYRNGQIYNGYEFTVGKDDPYNDLKLSNVVLAQKVKGGSKSLVIYEIADGEEGLKPTVVEKITRKKLGLIVETLVEDYSKNK